MRVLRLRINFTHSIVIGKFLKQITKNPSRKERPVDYKKGRLPARTNNHRQVTVSIVTLNI